MVTARGYQPQPAGMPEGWISPINSERDDYRNDDMFKSMDSSREVIKNLALDTEAIDRSFGEIEKQRLKTPSFAKGKIESKSQVFKQAASQFQEQVEVDRNVLGNIPNKFFQSDVNLDQLKINDTPLDSEFE